MPRKESVEQQRPMKRRKFPGLEERRQRIDDIYYHMARPDGRLDKLCRHGVAHPVGVIDPTPVRLSEPTLWVHECDGCCSGYARMKPEDYPKKGLRGNIL